jgi:hypothetical protein
MQRLLEQVSTLTSTKQIPHVCHHAMSTSSIEHRISSRTPTQSDGDLVLCATEIRSVGFCRLWAVCIPLQIAVDDSRRPTFQPATSLRHILFARVAGWKTAAGDPSRTLKEHDLRTMCLNPAGCAVVYLVRNIAKEEGRSSIDLAIVRSALLAPATLSAWLTCI